MTHTNRKHHRISEQIFRAILWLVGLTTFALWLYGDMDTWTQHVVMALGATTGLLAQFKGWFENLIERVCGWKATHNGLD